MAQLIPRKQYFRIAPADYLKTAPLPDVFILTIPHTAYRKELSQMKTSTTSRKLYGVAALAATLIGAAMNTAAAAPAGIKNVVLVHGAFADGSGWEAVAKILEKDGYTVSIAQPPETSYAEDQKYTKAAIDAMNGPVVLVGHSYGGSIITEAGNHPKVGALVCIAAFALDDGESCASIEQALPQVEEAATSRRASQ
jgi:pimeloyl-ACP methyl ester carboxylesterase